MPCARTSSTLLCLHVYLPSAKAFVQADNTCSSVALFPHSLHHGSSLNFHVQRFVGVGNMSYTELMAKRIVLDSIFQSSSHGSFLAQTDSHLSQLPCFFWATALVKRASSSPCRTSSWTSSNSTRLYIYPNRYVYYFLKRL